MIDLEEILSKMNPNQKINYDRVMQQMAKQWLKEEVRPRILVHVCCAPCSTYTLEYLTQYADLTVYFANSNIHPKVEYHRRAYVVQQFVSDFNERTGNQVQFIEAPYEPSEYFQKVHGLEEEPEGGDRCKVCFDYRLDKTAQMAVELGFDYFASALTSSSIAWALTCKKFMLLSICQVISKKIMATVVRLKCAMSMISTVNATVAVFLRRSNKALILLK